MQSAIVSRRQVLAGHAFFRDLPSAILDRVATRAHSSFVEKGATIFWKGDPASGLIAILSGLVKISASSDDGKEVVFDVLGKGEILGEIALLDGKPRTATATASTDCVLLYVDRRDFQELLLDEPSIAIRLLEVVSARLRRTSEQIEDSAFLEIDTRLARVVLRLAEAQGTVLDPQPCIAITQRELGDMVGRSRESTNRQLRLWEDDGVLRLETGRLHVLARLRLIALAGDREDRFGAPPPFGAQALALQAQGHA